MILTQIPFWPHASELETSNRRNFRHRIRYILMRIIIAIVALVFLASFKLSEVTQYIYNHDGIHVEYGKEKGMLHTKYTSYWPNGRKKAEGQMSANMRFGDWNLWDSSGLLVMARKYETGYVWTQLYPITMWPVTSKTWLAAENQRYSMYFTITPDSVKLSSRQWRFIPYVQHNPIFAKDALEDTLIAMRDRGVLQVGLDDEMRTLLSLSEFHARLEKCNTNFHVIGYKVKEDWWYDSKKQSGIFSIIAICPVYYAKNQRDSIDLGWINYDAALRGKLATMYYVPPYLTGYPTGVEQTFFLRCFASDVYRYSNTKHQTIAELYRGHPVEQALEVERMEIQPLEWEHDLWMEEFRK